MDQEWQLWTHKASTEKLHKEGHDSAKVIYSYPARVILFAI